MSDKTIKNSKAQDYLQRGSFASEWEACMVELGVHLEEKYNATEYNELMQKEAIKSHEVTQNLSLNLYTPLNRASNIKIVQHTTITELLGPKPRKEGGNS
jgi:squalene cyclase